MRVMLHQIAQHAEDLDRAVGFYRDQLALPLLGQFPGLAFFDLGGGIRLLIEQGASPALLYFATDDIHSEYARLLDAGVAFEDEPHRIHVHDGNLGQPAGTEEWMVFFRDSEGNLLGLNERRAPDAVP